VVFLIFHIQKTVNSGSFVKMKNKELLKNLQLFLWGIWHDIGGLNQSWAGI
jgi:hypothetical protein